MSGWTLIPSNQEIVDNGQLIASLPRMTYTRVVAVPGHHELRLHGRKAEARPLLNDLKQEEPRSGR